MYTVINYQTKKALKADFANGLKIKVYQPGPFGGKPINGQHCLEGPHYPEPHRWYAAAVIKDDVIVELPK